MLNQIATLVGLMDHSLISTDTHLLANALTNAHQDLHQMVIRCSNNVYNVIHPAKLAKTLD